MDVSNMDEECLQATLKLALIPGVSRSGVTITAALLLGMDRQSSARFSFLLSIPVIASAGGLLVVDLRHAAGLAGADDAVQGQVRQARDTSDRFVDLSGVTDGRYPAL